MIYEGYGLTETSPVSASTGPGAGGSARSGRPIPGVEIRIAEDGEVLTRGPHIMKGYWGKPDETPQGHRPGRLVPHRRRRAPRPATGTSRITDRKKELIVIAGGKNVAPAADRGGAQAVRFVASAVADRRPAEVPRRP